MNFFWLGLGFLSLLLAVLGFFAELSLCVRRKEMIGFLRSGGIALDCWGKNPQTIKSWRDDKSLVRLRRQAVRRQKAESRLI